MEHAHERLETLIEHFANTPANTELLFIPDLQTFKNLFTRETMNIKNFLTRKLLSIENERNFELLVHQYQSLISIWLDKLSEAKKNANCQKEVVDLATDELEKLLYFMHERYERFFNLDENVAEISLEKIRQNLKGHVQMLQGRLLKECANEVLTTLLLSPLHDLLNSGPKKKITYRYLLYTKRIEKALSNFSNAEYTGTRWEDKHAIELMVLMNYNHPEVAQFIISKMAGDIKMLETIEDKRDQLRFFLKEFNHLNERNDIAYKPSSSSLKEQMIGWISEEMIYLGKGTPSYDNKSKQSLPNDEKLQFSLPAGALTLIARAAKENKVIMNKHHREVYKILSKYIST